MLCFRPFHWRLSRPAASTFALMILTSLFSLPGLTPSASGQSISLADVTGDYRRNPLGNGWHAGEISPSPGGQLKWTNRAGTSWSLRPALSQNLLVTGADNPYQSQGGRNFKLLLSGGRVVGFVFNGDRFDKQDTDDAPAKPVCAAIDFEGTWIQGPVNQPNFMMNQGNEVTLKRIAGGLLMTDGNGFVSTYVPTPGKANTYFYRRTTNPSGQVEFEHSGDQASLVIVNANSVETSIEFAAGFAIAQEQGREVGSGKPVNPGYVGYAWQRTLETKATFDTSKMFEPYQGGRFKELYNARQNPRLTPEEQFYLAMAKAFGPQLWDENEMRNIEVTAQIKGGYYDVNYRDLLKNSGDTVYGTKWLTMERLFDYQGFKNIGRRTVPFKMPAGEIFFSFTKIP